MTIHNNYKLLPFRFERREINYLLVNETGDHIFIENDDFKKFIDKTLKKETESFKNLKSKFFLYDQSLSNIIDTLSVKYRTKNKFLYDYTSLHMFVVTYRCNQECTYCHASSENENSNSVKDMDSATAKKCVEFAFNSPSHDIKIEFQGGEPLLNFDIVKTIIEHAESINERYNKRLEFVLCTNLTKLTIDHLNYLKEKNVVISTSLDGPREIHNQCRKFRSGEGTYDDVINNLKFASSELEKGMVSALMTVTPYNVNRLKEVVDEYLEQGIGYIFIRNLNPLGFAYNNQSINYPISDFINGYKEALDYIININASGVFFPEVFSTILLSRILTPFSTGFVDLQSPTGAAISGVIYDTNGDIFVSDEARMTYRTTGDKKFSIGNVNVNSWKEAYCNKPLRDLIENSCIDALPGCAWCVYKVYCGSDPVRNYLAQGDMVGHRPTNHFCHKHKAIFNLLFSYIDKNEEIIDDVFWSWITNRHLNQIIHYNNDQTEI